MSKSSPLAVVATTIFVLVVTAAVVAGFYFLIRHYPYIGVPGLVILVALGWWRVYDAMMRRAEAAYERQRRERKR